MLTTVSSYAEDRDNDEQIWNDLYTWLLSLVEKWVAYAHVTCWYGQQKEVSEDIAQEAILRVLRYRQRARRGEVQPIVSLKSLSKVIAQNYFRDRRRKDQYLVRPSQNTDNAETYVTARDLADPLEIALDHLLTGSVIVAAAQVVANFPDQQRVALLMDLANTSDFNDPPTLLEQALSAKGIQLRDYCGRLPAEPSTRSLHAANLCVAYKRLRRKVQLAIA
jgi:DNA-directed RNA polymerase specialized sigma24 family protein